MGMIGGSIQSSRKAALLRAGFTVRTEKYIFGKLMEPLQIGAG